MRETEEGKMKRGEREEDKQERERERERERWDEMGGIKRHVDERERDIYK